LKTAASLDPRTKLVLVMVVSTLAVWSRDIRILSFLLAISLLACAWVGSDMGGLFKKVKRFIWIFVAMAVIQSLFTPGGTPWIAWGRITLISDLGLLRGAQIVLRFLIIVTSALVMTSSHAREIIQGLVQWRIPYELAFMVSVAIRFLPLLQEEITDMLTAIQLRGVNLKHIPIPRRLKTYSYLLMPMIASVLMKSRDLSTAMEMRAFRAYPTRTSLRQLAFGTLDYVVMACSGFVLIVTVWLMQIV
jgi:energy-coupling factor transport system permease protein